LSEFPKWKGEKIRGWEDEKQKIEDGSKNSEARIQSTDKKCKIKVDLMDAHDLKFPDKSFDIVLLYEAMYYLKDPEKRRIFSLINHFPIFLPGFLLYQPFRVI